MIWERKGIINYLTLEGMQSRAIEAIECVKVVRQWLPIKAAEKTLSSSQMMDRWYEDMANRCIAFFRYHPRMGVYATTGPKPSGNLWQELCLAMSELREHYDLQDVDGGNEIPHSNVRGCKKLKPIDAGILDRIEQAANGLLGIVEGPPVDTELQKGIDIRVKSNGLTSWPDICEQVTGVREGHRSFSNRVREYAEKTKQQLPEAGSGSKPKRH